MLDKSLSHWDQAGWATYAAIMLFGGGLVGIVNGIWALRYHDRLADLVLAEKNIAVWGWISLIGGIFLMQLFGFTLNLLTLLAIVLSVGLVVDDAIVVVEAVTAKMEGGMKPQEATVAAMKEVSGPIVATSLSLIAVFVAPKLWIYQAGWPASIS